MLRIRSCARMRTKNKLWNNIVLSVTFWPTNKTTAAVCCYSHCPCSSSKDAMHNNIIVINHRNNISNIFCIVLQIFGSAFIEGQPNWLFDPFKLSLYHQNSNKSNDNSCSLNGAMLERLFWISSSKLIFVQYSSIWIIYRAPGSKIPQVLLRLIYFG